MVSGVTSPEGTINSDGCDVSPEENQEMQENPKEKENPEEKQEVIIAVAGKSGAGKTTLAHKILGRELEEEASPDLTTEKSEIMSEIKGGVKLTIIDNPGLMTGKEKKQLDKQYDYAREEKQFLHLLLYCVPVSPAAKFEDCNPQIMKSLQSKFGKGIWKNCIIAFTFANHARRKQYKEYIKKYARKFNEELQKNLKVQDVEVKTIFELDEKQNLENAIIAVPVGDDDDDEVIPDLQNGEKWLDILRIQMIKKAKEECKLKLQKYWNLQKIVGITTVAGGVIAGVGAGALVGAGVGLVGGPVSAIAGGVVGGIVGGAVMGASGGAIGGTIMTKLVNEMKEEKQNKKHM